MALPNVVTNIGAVRPHVRPVAEEIATKFAPIYFLWGKSNGTTGEHPKGLALDFSILEFGRGVSDPGRARTSLGQKIADYVWANRSRLNVWYVIWNRKIISANRDSYAYHRWVTYKGSSNPHTDHVHVSFWGTGTYAPPPVAGAGGGSATRTVSLRAVRAAAQADPGRRQGGTTPGAGDDVRLVEAALQREGLLSATWSADGSFGSKTVKAYAAWQRRCGYSGSDADGIPGGTTLKRLGDRHGFKVVA